MRNQNCAERPPNDHSEMHDLPPHRAAVPVPPIILTEALSPRRRLPPWPSIAIAIALHFGLLAAALRWGQGEALPPVEDAIAVELVEHIGRLAREATGRPTTPESPVALAELAATTQAEPSMRAEERGTKATSSDRPAANGPETAPAMLAAGDAASNREPPQPRKHLRRPLEASLERLRTVRNGTLAALQVRPSEERHALASVHPPLPVQKTLAQPTAATGEAMRPDDAPPPPDRISAAPIAMTMYKRRLRLRVRQNLPLGLFGPGRVAIRLRLSPSGRVAGASVLRSSGSSAMDRAALRSVQSAGPYPVPPRGAVPAQLAFAINFRFE